jgi:protein-S-isoprenylcysteine O-methyltransferase Ste14
MSALELKIPPVLLTALFAVLMWLISRITPSIILLSAFRISSLLLFVAAGAFVGLAGVAAFRKAGTTVNPLSPDSSTSLVITGILTRTRNPMYLALLLALIGWSAYLANLFALALTAGFVLYMNRFQIQPEERALEAQFGDQFIEYSRKVRRWV